MRTYPRLGAVNAAVIAAYFTVVWGIDAVRALTSPFNGFDDRGHAVAAAYFREVFNFGLDGMIRTANVLATIKLVIAAGFLAYLIDFFRALLMRREPNRETLDAVLLLAACGIMLWAWPALGSGDGGLIRLQATQFLLLTGAMFVLVVERHLDEASAQRPNSAEPATTARAPLPRRGAMSLGRAP